MNGSSYPSKVPQDVTFFIGPLGAPEIRKKAYENAVVLAKAGDNSAIDKLLERMTDRSRHRAQRQ